MGEYHEVRDGLPARISVVDLTYRPRLDGLAKRWQGRTILGFASTLLQDCALLALPPDIADLR